jgi:uncharacterized protein
MKKASSYLCSRSVGLAAALLFAGSALADMRSPDSPLVPRQNATRVCCTHRPAPEHLVAWGAAQAFRFYQQVVSRGDGDRCRFTPSCSEYARLAVREYGLLRGSVMAADRLMRDHSWNSRYYPLVRVEGRGLVLYNPLPLPVRELDGLCSENCSLDHGLSVADE